MDPPAAVVVNHDAGDLVLSCVASLRAAGVREIVVVDNASSDGALARLAAADASVRLLPTGANLGYGAGANRGVAATSAEYVLICNPDLVLDARAPCLLAGALAARGDLAACGPLIREPSGARYPSTRAFPSYPVAALHALLGPVRPENRWSRRYRLEHRARSPKGDVDWISGACMAVRRTAFTSVGGFDEGYFMYVEDLDLCWRLRRAGWQVGYLEAAEVTHVQGVSASRRPLAMLLAHHRSTWRFARKSARGPERALLPLVAVFLALRLVALAARELARRSHTRAGPSTHLSTSGNGAPSPQLTRPGDERSASRAARDDRTS